MVRVQPRARDLVTHEEYLRLGMTSPLNNCPGGIGPELRKRYAMFQLAKKEEAAYQEKLAKWVFADADRPPLSEKAQRRKEKRKRGRNNKKKENMDSESSKTPGEKLDTESKTPYDQLQLSDIPRNCPPELAKRLERAAILIKELEAGNNTFEVVTELLLVENILEKISFHFKSSGLFSRNWTCNRVTPRDYVALRSKFNLDATGYIKEQRAKKELQEKSTTTTTKQSEKAERKKEKKMKNKKKGGGGGSSNNN